jgi:hypothetical protein
VTTVLTKNWFRVILYICNLMIQNKLLKVNKVQKSLVDILKSNENLG